MGIINAILNLFFGGNKKKEVKAVKEDIKPYYADDNTKRL